MYMYPILQYMGNKFHISIHPCIEILPYSHFPTNILIGLYVTTIIGHMEIIANNSHVLLLNLHVHITCSGGNPYMYMYKTVFLYNNYVNYLFVFSPDLRGKSCSIASSICCTNLFIEFLVRASWMIFGCQTPL